MPSSYCYVNRLCGFSTCETNQATRREKCEKQEPLKHPHKAPAIKALCSAANNCDLKGVLRGTESRPIGAERDSHYCGRQI